jgi:NodT family efflux transporter outer membrane factor (OMF) lipoprotein
MHRTILARLIHVETTRARLGVTCIATLVTIATIAGCTVGPDYVRPSAPVAAQYRENPPTTGDWKTAQPRVVDPSTDPWSVFNDPTLIDLINEASRANQSVAQADANYRAARALVVLARSALFPTIGASAGVTRSRSPSNATRGGSEVDNAHTITLQASWEPDLWGSVRRSVEAADASAQSSAANLAAVRLSIQSEVAQDYLGLRINDELHDLLQSSVDAFDKALKLSQSQFKAGTVSRSDVALATALLKSTQSQLTDVAATRAVFEHAIAVLLGKSPSEFTLPPAPLKAVLPAVPVGLPSDLLERRPDIAFAERQAAAANANIGVAQAAYYPSLLLGASGGDSLAGLSQFFSAPGRVWSLGATLAQVLFDGGARHARTDQATASFDAAVAQYRQTVLSGFQEVEDNLATLRVLEDEQASDDDAVSASRDAERIALSQYRAGTTTYLSVITAQTTALSNARVAVQLRGRRYSASVSLIRAIGGGWSDTMLAATSKTATVATGPSAQ